MSSLPKPTDTRPYRAPSATGPEITVTGKEQRQTLRQVGWLGGTGAFYALDEKPSHHEPGSFTPLWFIAHSDRIDPPEDFTEYGSVYVEPDGSRSDVTPLGRDRDYALGQFRAIAHGLEDTQWVVAFVSRRRTQTAWTTAEQPKETDGA